ncbi:MAG: hypothetical protein K0041_05640 [Acidithiobacillus sp.]|nr:hypothetical protein [Acidithiobacillus sp.]
MYAIKVLFSQPSVAAQARETMEKTLTEGSPPEDFAAALRKILAQPCALEPAVFAEQEVFACTIAGLDAVEAAMAEAAFLDAGALEVIAE